MNESDNRITVLYLESAGDIMLQNINCTSFIYTPYDDFLSIKDSYLATCISVADLQGKLDI